MITRRRTLQLLGTVAASAYLASSLPALAQNVAVQDLAVPGPLGDVALGPADAKVTIVEYASLTCSHCAAFHANTWPEFKKRYIETGKVRFILREFPLDPLATAGFMLARCDGDSKYYPITDLLFDQQKNWAFTDKPLDALRQMMRQAGFSQEKFDACLRDQKLYDAVNAVKNRAADQFKVDSTPTFFINGVRYPGSMSIDELEKIIKPLLGE
ncbi:DsbA family protein [Microvirga alba]|uniref:DsbA family protein n=1 Tax=Microvirga alba TaxID=2791025 RepID=A0A931BNF3_9HYPH|nr:DsbA family protein [Microvirga alba]MBF9231824.1 DsbA family protein [Microvirga alba]